MQRLWGLESSRYDDVRDWPCHQATDDPVIGCCALELSSSLRNCASHLADRRIFPHLGSCEVTGMSANSSLVVNFHCRNQLTPTSAYHLLHFLHHLNGSAFHRVNAVMIDDPLEPIEQSSGYEQTGVQLEPAILSALLSAYMASGVCPAKFRLRARVTGAHFPPHAEPLMPAYACWGKEMLLHCVRDTRDDISVVLDWVVASLHSNATNDGVGGDLFCCMAPPHCQTVSLTIGTLTGAKVQRILEVGYYFQSISHCHPDFRPSSG